MIRSLLVCCLAASVPLVAQDAKGSFQLDVHRVSPSLEGHVDGIQDGNPLVVDFQNDFGIQKDATKVGLSLEYQGPRFGVELSAEEQDYLGHNYVQRDIKINGSTFHAGALVDSDIKVKNYTFNWTIRAFKWPQFWIGLDLGVRVWDLDMTASAYEPATTVYVPPVVEKLPVPIPQVGLATGFHALDDRIVGRGYYHLLTYKGASYHHAGVDIRYFPVNWLGIRFFSDTETFDAPKGSIKDDLEVRLDRKGTGAGVVLRF